MTEYLIVAVLGLVTLGAIAFPFVTGIARYQDRGDLEADVRRYRAALAADTVCSRCRAASAPGSRFCIDCGHEL